MPEYLYTAWFRDADCDAEDQDHEWCACILITADSDVAAQRWGDYLAEGFVKRHPNEHFIMSKAEPETQPEVCRLAALPRASYGEFILDEEIGW
jgi:hypothetical protein